MLIAYMAKRNVYNYVGILGGTLYKRPYGDVPPTWVAKSASWYISDPLQNAKFGIWMINFSKFSQIWANLKKFGKNRVILLKNLAQNWADWYKNGPLFLEKLVFVWVYFQILRQYVPTKTKFEYLPPRGLWQVDKQNPHNSYFFILGYSNSSSHLISSLFEQ